MGVIGWVGGLEPGSGTDTGPREPVSVNAGYGDWLADEGWARLSCDVVWLAVAGMIVITMALDWWAYPQTLNTTCWNLDPKNWYSPQGFFRDKWILPEIKDKKQMMWQKLNWALEIKLAS
jgi:hypothetical protein